ncbi:hypothetical protein [Bacillus altitudinis]|uniref:hypothetical protein n=1 Tax=Bacillus altitudinis TaxID=293387 RepID=UPI0030C7A7FD
MQTKEFLLTYEKNGKTDFGWFESEDEMKSFYEENDGLKILDCLRIGFVEEINFLK